MTFVVLMGPPGVGKGTQSKRLAEHLGLKHVSTGDLFRHHLREGTPVGTTVKGFMSRGELVPDEVVIAMVQDVVAKGGEGFVLDGFPRTVAQAQAVESLAATAGAEGRVPLVAVELVTSEREILRRLTGRRVCTAEGHVYHVDFNPPREPGVCDIDGSPLQQRSDDSEATVARRLEVYRLETSPVLEYFRRSGRLQQIDGEGTPDAVEARLQAVVASVLAQSVAE